MFQTAKIQETARKKNTFLKHLTEDDAEKRVEC